MAYYNICPNCEATLDPGEKCDCQRENTRRQESMNRLLRVEKTGQVALTFGTVEGSYGKENAY